MAAVYDSGDVVRISVTFTNFAGVGTNPTTVVLSIRTPAGVITTPSPTSSGLGVYFYDLTLNAEGEWMYRWAGTGAIIAAVEGVIAVGTSVFV